MDYILKTVFVDPYGGVVNTSQDETTNKREHVANCNTALIRLHGVDVTTVNLVKLGWDNFDVDSSGALSIKLTTTKKLKLK